jgi:hypothetical protein
MRLYIIEESLTEAEVRKIVDFMPDWFKIEAYEFNKSLICINTEINGKNIGFAIMSEQQIVKSLELVGYIGMSVKIIDITQKAIDGKLDQEILDDSYIMENIINKYILENVDKDAIFDKINKYGIESLTKIDYTLLDS